MKILLFGGTTEGRLLALELAKRGYDVTVSVATNLGAEELAGAQGLTLRVGRMDRGGMETVLPGFDLALDATHPYAAEVTKNLREACEATGTAYLRLLRKSSADDGVISVASCAEAAEYLAGQPGNVLLAIGAKELGAFAALDPERLFARVLPTADSIRACEAIGLRHRNIIALQGPFTEEMNSAMVHQYGISWMVTKDGGKAGGYEEKANAAKKAGVGLVLVARPAEESDGLSFEEILQAVEEMA